MDFARKTPKILLHNGRCFLCNDRVVGIGKPVGLTKE